MKAPRLPNFDRGNLESAALVLADPSAPEGLRRWANLVQARLRGVTVAASPGIGQASGQAGDSGASLSKQKQMEMFQVEDTGRGGSV